MQNELSLSRSGGSFSLQKYSSIVSNIYLGFVKFSINCLANECYDLSTSKCVPVLGIICKT